MSSSYDDDVSRIMMKILKCRVELAQEALLFALDKLQNEQDKKVIVEALKMLKGWE